MKEKILILVLSALVVIQFVLSLRSPKVDTSYFEREYRRINREQNEYKQRVNQSLKEIKLIKYEMALYDSIKPFHT